MRWLVNALYVTIDCSVPVSVRKEVTICNSLNLALLSRLFLHHRVNPMVDFVCALFIIILMIAVRSVVTCRVFSVREKTFLDNYLTSYSYTPCCLL